MSLVSLALLGAYFAGGIQFMMANEGWDAADAFYFWCCPCMNQIVALRPRLNHGLHAIDAPDASSIDLRAGA